MELNITWLEGPITETEILVIAIGFRDKNPIHHSSDAAKKRFGSDATGVIAPGGAIIGWVGGEITRLYGDNSIVHGLTDLKFQRCICPGDELGYILDVESDEIKVGIRFVRLAAKIFRKRGDKVVPICKRSKLKAEIVVPAQ